MAGLTVYRSNRIEALAELLIQQLRAPGGMPADPMEEVQIVVGSRGQGRWLRHRIATAMGICAQVKFPFPEAFIQQLLDDVLGPQPDADRLTWSRGTLALGLLEIDADADTPVTARDLSSAAQLATVFDRYGLYRPSLARHWSGLDCPDPPRVPDALQWQAKLWRDLSKRQGSAHFAARAAQATTALQTGQATPTERIRVFGFASMPPAWLELLGEAARRVPVDLYTLCPSIQGWDHIHTAAADAPGLRGIDRDTALPDQLDLSVLHPLHQSLGRAARDTQIVLESLQGAPMQIGVDETLSTDADNHTALHQLQSDILHCRQPGTSVHTLSPTDRSIQIHECHGPSRQVEVIRDVILGLLQDHPELEPRDIVIMTPDVATYAPIVEGCFSRGSRFPAAGDQPWGDAGVPQIAVEIADLSVQRTNPVADALLRVLRAASDRVTASAALDLIALGPVSSRFGLSPEQVGRLREVVVQSGIRWGLDGRDRQRAGHTADIQNTFAFGLDRLALGVAMADEGVAISLSPEDAQPLSPWDHAEQGETLDLLGRFFDFCEALDEVVTSLRAPRPLKEWIARLCEAENGCLDRLTRTEGPSQWLTQRIREELDILGREAQAADSQRMLELEALISLISDRFDVPSQISRQQTGAITCCALRPMRSVPYKVVCLVGMDEGQFPRQGALPGFDWTAISPRVGDRIPRDEGRLMLLEAILSARSHLVISYTGRHVRTNRHCQPCVPIAELRDVIDRSFTCGESKASDTLTTTHTLHAFDPENFQGTPGDSDTQRPRSFDHQLLATARASLGERSDPPFLPPHALASASLRAPDVSIELASLSEALSNPSRVLLRSRFDLRLREYLTHVEDGLPVELSKYEQRRIERAMLETTLMHMAALGEDIPEDPASDDWLTPTVDSLRAAGTLPPGAAALHALEPQLGLMAHLSQTCADLMTEPPQTVHVRVPLTIQGRTVEVVGPVHNIRDGHMVVFVPTSDATGGSMWWLIEPWVQLMAWMASDASAGQRMGIVHAYTDKGEPKIQFRVFGPRWAPDVQQANARAMLQWMVETQQAALDRPVPIFPSTSCQFARAVHNLNNSNPDAIPLGPESFGPDAPIPDAELMASVMEKLRPAWGSANSMTGDAKEVHIAHLYGTAEPYIDPSRSRQSHPEQAFAQLALQLWLPIVSTRKMIRSGKNAVAQFMDKLAGGGTP